LTKGKHPPEGGGEVKKRDVGHYDHTKLLERSGGGVKKPQNTLESAKGVPRKMVGVVLPKNFSACVENSWQRFSV